MIGTCEACSKTGVPVRLWNFNGMDTVQCFRCVGDAEADPYGELTDDAAIAAIVAVAKLDKPDECEYPNCKCPRVGRCGKATKSPAR